MNGISRLLSWSACAARCLAAASVMAAGLAQADPLAACLGDPARAHELRVLDEAQIIDLMEGYEVVAAPPRLYRAMDHLIAAAPRLRDGPAIHLLAYRDTELNAYAADHGLVILTTAMWSGEQRLSDDELAAVIAHELAHIESRDSLVEACANLQRLAQPQLGIDEVRERMAREMFNRHSDFARAAREELHAQEHAADVRGIELLRLVGRDPAAMVSMLTKIHGTQPNGLNLLMGSSHPELRQRLARAQAAVNAPAGGAAAD